MAYHYSDTERESETYSLPNVETFKAHHADDPVGPFATEAEAIADFQDHE